MMQETIYLIISIILGIGFFLLIREPDKKITDKYIPEHIDDFVNFAKMQLHLSQVDAVVAIREKFPNLTLTEAVEVYHLAKNK